MLKPTQDNYEAVFYGESGVDTPDQPPINSVAEPLDLAPDLQTVRFDGHRARAIEAVINLAEIERLSGNE